MELEGDPTSNIISYSEAKGTNQIQAVLRRTPAVVFFFLVVVTQVARHDILAQEIRTQILHSCV